MKENFFCSICGEPSEDFGANPHPFGGDRCCDDCDNRFVIPVRIIYGRDQVNKDFCDALAKIAALGKSMVAAKKRHQVEALERASANLIQGLEELRKFEGKSGEETNDRQV